MPHTHTHSKKKFCSHTKQSWICTVQINNVFLTNYYCGFVIMQRESAIADLQAYNALQRDSCSSYKTFFFFILPNDPWIAARYQMFRGPAPGRGPVPVTQHAPVSVNGYLSNKSNTSRHFISCPRFTSSSIITYCGCYGEGGLEEHFPTGPK